MYLHRWSSMSTPKYPLVWKWLQNHFQQCLLSYTSKVVETKLIGNIALITLYTDIKSLYWSPIFYWTLQQFYSIPHKTTLNSIWRAVNIPNSIWKTVDHTFKPLQVLRLQTNGFLWSNPCWNYSTHEFLFIFCYFQSLEKLHFNNIFAAKYTRSLQYQYYL